MAETKHENWPGTDDKISYIRTTKQLRERASFLTGSVRPTKPIRVPQGGVRWKKEDMLE